jgi:histidinol phosphatase-like enzyme
MYLNKLAELRVKMDIVIEDVSKNAEFLLSHIESLSYFIGDKERDMHCAEMAEVKGIKINENQPFPKYDEVNLA